MTCRLSVLVAAHNEAAFIAEALQSAFVQDLSDFEIIVVDDGSDDDTARIVEGLFGEAPAGMRLRLLRSDGNHGLAHARNSALSQARGEYVALLDADDRLASGALGRLLARLERDRSTRLAFPLYRWMGRDGTPLPHSSPVPTGPIGARAILLENPIHSDSGVTMRRGDLAAIGGFDDRLTGYVGADAWVRFALFHGENSLAPEPEAVVHYRRHEAQITANWRRMDRNWRVLVTKLDGEFAHSFAPIRAVAEARHDLFCSHLAYKAAEYREARRLLTRALRSNPAMLMKAEARTRTLACIASLLPERLHRGVRERFDPGDARSGQAP